MKMQVAIHPRLRLSPLVLILLVLMGVGFVVSMIRLIYGIGAISNLSNTYPWGFWISFDIFSGIAIASGAFILASIVYIFDLKEFRPLLKPALLTALLGYLMEIIALLVDLGRPERIWHIIIYQNPNSFLLVVGLCVIIYTAVLAVEFAPVVLNGAKKHALARLVQRFILPLVILGVVVSIIHQSSLGGLMLIQPEKLHPLWWTPMLPVLFFISSLAIGLAMIIFESSLSSRAFRRGLEVRLLEKLARAIPFVLAVYLVFRFGDLVISGSFKLVLSSGMMSALFWAEILLGAVTPMVLFLRRQARLSPGWLLLGAVSLLLGMILNRFNASWFAVSRLTNVTYVPNWMEIAVSAAIFSAGILAFGLVARYLPLFEEEG